MSKLQGYSIETDHTVLLQYADGRDKRVPLQLLEEYVSTEDFKKIHKTVNMRQSFFKKHLPRISLLLVVGSVLTFGGMSENQRLQQILIPHSSKPTAPSTVDPKSTINVVNSSSTPSYSTLRNSSASTPQPKPESQATPKPQIRKGFFESILSSRQSKEKSTDKSKDWNKDQNNTQK